MLNAESVSILKMIQAFPIGLIINRYAGQAMNLVPFDKNIEALLKEENARLVGCESILDWGDNAHWLFTRCLKPPRNFEPSKYLLEALAYLSMCHERREAIPVSKDKLAQMMVARERAHCNIAARIALAQVLNEIPPYADFVSYGDAGIEMYKCITRVKEMYEAGQKKFDYGCKLLSPKGLSV